MRNEIMEPFFIASFIGIFVATVWTIIIVVFVVLMLKFRKGMMNQMDSELIAHIAMAEAQEIDITADELKLHRDAGGDIANVVTSMIAAKMEGKSLTFAQACAQDLEQQN